MLLEAEFWVAVGFFLFVGVLVYYGIPKKMLDALDRRTARIKVELDDDVLTISGERKTEREERKKAEPVHQVSVIRNQASGESGIRDQ